MKHLWKYLISVCVLLASTITHAGWTVRYQHTDVQGSVIAESNTQGSITQRFDYKPFGEGTPTQKSGLGYTGHLEDTDLGLTYMQQRYYDPVVGRFYSNDPISFRNADSFNRYVYANNNPYKYIDPTGMMSCTVGNDGVEVCTTTAKRPSSRSFWNHYLRYNNTENSDRGYAADEVWNKIGGNVGQSNLGEDSCAARISLALNFCNGGFEYSKGVTFMNYSGENKGLRFILNAAELEKNLTNRWGPPDYKNVTLDEIEIISEGLIGDQIAIIVSPEHATVIKNGYRDEFYEFSAGGSAWILPSSDN